MLGGDCRLGQTWNYKTRPHPFLTVNSIHVFQVCMTIDFTRFFFWFGMARDGNGDMKLSAPVLGTSTSFPTSSRTCKGRQSRSETLPSGASRKWHDHKVLLVGGDIDLGIGGLTVSAGCVMMCVAVHEAMSELGKMGSSSCHVTLGVCPKDDVLGWSAWATFRPSWYPGESRFVCLFFLGCWMTWYGRPGMD